MYNHFSSFNRRNRALKGIKSPRYTKRRTECKGGCSEGRPRLHDSIEEARYCDRLKLLVQAGEIISYKTQVRYNLFDYHKKPCGYMIVDFEAMYPGNELRVIEYKGKLFGTLPEFRHKKALFSWCHPEVIYCVVNKGDILL